MERRRTCSVPGAVTVPSARREAVMFQKRIELLQLFGFRVYVDVSWLIIAALVTWSLASGVFPQSYPELRPLTYWIMGLIGALMLFLSIVVHEFSHSLVARRSGLPMKSITLFLFGGVAEMEAQPKSPGAEFSMAVAGPIASILLGGLFLALSAWGLAQSWPTPLRGILSYLGVINLVLAGFNLLPAFPLDGGRILRSLLWHWKHDLLAATQIAARVGRVFGWLLVAIGALNIFRGGLVGGLWLILIGLFLRSIAQRAYQEMRLRFALRDEALQRFIDDDAAALSPDLPVDEFVEEYLYRRRGRTFAIVADGKLKGCVGPAQVRRIPKRNWARKTIGQLSRRCPPKRRIGVDESAADAFDKMRRQRLRSLFVVDGERLLGTVRLESLLRFVSAKLDLESPAGDEGSRSPGP
ncbi:MAG: CBS domain-containing protein [Candidatus Eisenbacteria bacterium]|nr:CBS domain-containing protein [Candidatus Eisenbacteria bacterium]